MNQNRCSRSPEYADVEGDIFAEIIDQVPVTNLARQRTSTTSLSGDFKALLKKKIETTEREAMINARIGQGRFRDDVLKIWDYRCAVTEATTLDAIRASHIKAWRFADDEEKLDPNNGLPLIASLDALFDAGLITFNDDGLLLISKMLTASERKIFGLEDTKLKRKPNKKMIEYLSFHNEKIFHQ